MQAAIPVLVARNDILRCPELHGLETDPDRIMAGVMWAEKDLPYCPKGGMSFGVRLLLEYLETLE